MIVKYHEHMTEPVTHQEHPPVTEHINPSQFTALHGRLALSFKNGDHKVLDPQKKDIPAVSKDQFETNLEGQNFDAVDNASTGERRAQAKGKTVDQWVQENTSVFKQSLNDKTGFDEGRATRWNTFLSSVFDVQDRSQINEAAVRKFYDVYCGEKTNTKALVQKLTQMFDGNYREIEQNRDIIQWISKVFGMEYSELEIALHHTLVQERLIGNQVDTFITEVNDTPSGQTLSRINRPTSQNEIPVCEYLYGEGAALDTKPEIVETAKRQLPKKEITPIAANSKKAKVELSGEVDEIIAGRGFEYIAKHGWEAYRSALKNISYGNILENQLKEIVSLNKEELSLPDKTTESEIITNNHKANLRIKKLRNDLPIQINQDIKGPFFCLDVPDTSKLTIRGRNYESAFEKDGALTKEAYPMTRFYITVKSQVIPEAFMSLFDELKGQGDQFWDHADLSLNYGDTSVDINTHNTNNSIIIMINGEDSNVFETIVKALASAQSKNPEMWHLSPKYLAQSKVAIATNFLIPLNDTVGFVEMPSRSSFDTTQRINIGKEIFGQGYPPEFKDLKYLRFFMKKFNPENPGNFKNPSLSNRRKYMPALLMDAYQ